MTEIDDPTRAAPSRVASALVPEARSALRFATIFGSAVVLGQVGQIAWLTSGSRAMATHPFATVLAAQALYALLQTFVDSGTSLHGARMAAAGALDEAARAAVVRCRIQFAAAGAVFAIAVGAIGGGRSLTATAPYAAALVLFALMNYWESFGYGESRPWSAYVVLRTAAPAAAASLFLVLGPAFPVFVPGAVECAVIVAVASVFRLRPVTDALRALRARKAPWRTALDIGLPFLLTQITLAAGVVMLNASREAASAGILAVAVRLVTGVDGLTLVLVTALFPGLARRGGVRDDTSTADARTIGIAMDIVVVVAAAAMAVLLARPAFFVDLFLNRASETAQATTILIFGGALAAGYSFLLTMVLVARRFEAVILRAYGFSTVLTLVGSAAVVVADPPRPALAMAAPLLCGQLLTAWILERQTGALLPATRTAVRRRLAAAVAFVAIGAAASAGTEARPILAIASAAVAAVFATRGVRRRAAGRPTG